MLESNDLTPAARRLKDALVRSLASASFDIGRIEYQDAHDTTTSFGARPGEEIERDALADLLRSAPNDAARARNARTLLAPDLRSKLADVLRSIVDSHLESDRIASAVPLPHDLESATTATEDRFFKHVSVSSLRPLPRMDPAMRCLAWRSPRRRATRGLGDGRALSLSDQRRVVSYHRPKAFPDARG